jgi:hypothetical protein
MTTILDDQLYLHSDRLSGKVVLITGGSQFLTCATAMPIGVNHPAPVFSQVVGRASEGRQHSSVPNTSMSSLVCSPGNKLIPHTYSPYRAKLVLGDINESTVQSVAAEIKRARG